MNNMPWIEQAYSGSLTISYFLYKNKWNATIGLIFGKFIKRLFVLNMENQTLNYYKDTSYKDPHIIELSVCVY